MYEETHIVPMPLSLKPVREEIERFLQSAGLKYGRLDYYAGVYRGDELIAGGGLEEYVMKCFIVQDSARGMNLMGGLVDHLRSVGTARGYSNFFIFTKPSNAVLFTSLAFNLIGRASNSILLESTHHGIETFCANLATYKRPGKTGAIVMNCNPMTLGHRYLIETAAQQVDTLHIFVVSEDKSEFSSQERLEMVQQGTAHIPNVFVHDAGKYIISFATFPIYFFKTRDDMESNYIELDLNIFEQYIAPALDLNVRFVGTEPLDYLTSMYNKMMKEILPKSGIEVVEIERLNSEEHPISASRVRKNIHNLHLQAACDLIPPTSRPYVRKKLAEFICKMAIEALTEELETTPKPGLVDRHDSGAHRDMDIKLMRKSISTLAPYFRQMAEAGLENADGLIPQIRQIGIDAEAEMLRATGGVNTHRGAIFALGITIVATCRLIVSGSEIIEENLQNEIAKVAGEIRDLNSEKSISHGAVVCEKYNVKGAMAIAVGGYSEVFESILPVYRQMLAVEHKVDVNIRTLLYIMSKIDDTNVYHRKGAEIANYVKNKSLDIYHNYSIFKVEELNRSFIRDNISPGGSADILSLTIFINKILESWLN